MQVSSFRNKKLKISIRAICNEDEIFFIATDVMKALEFKTQDEMMKKLENHQVIRVPKEELSEIYTRGSTVPIVSEGGFYHLVFFSNKKHKEQIKTWVVDDVIKNLRKGEN